ncbi:MULTISPECIES: very short patch repair endonuclease [Henriciella]|uniref:very short patch repair endonuclease n=1 Tax=Henriciella TaxID=453849 RepID=UPI00351463D8
MADIVPPKVRSRMMSGIRGKDTKPELIVRRGLHAMGFRYTLHNRRLPGSPDLVLPKHDAVIFVHGCFWHGHDCHLFKWPQTRPEFWREKIGRNRERDARSLAALRASGWRIATIWECALRAVASSDRLLLEVSSWITSDQEILDVSGAQNGT